MTSSPIRNRTTRLRKPATALRADLLRRLLVSSSLLSLAAAAYAQPTSVVNSPHNLSAGGPGNVHAATEDQVCIFCHAPHNSTPVRPLWNRNMSTEAYTIYTS